MQEPAKILIVDDDPDYVEITRSILESKGYRVDTAHSKAEAEQKLAASRPDLIILDIIMDRMNDGFKLCYQLKHDPQTRTIPVFAISSVNQVTGFTFSPQTDGEYFEADDFAEKPIKADELLKRVEVLLRKK
ncbi:MAG: response regulator [candidate division KSB1 bacterium]|nr:response regulator [candidate division KSB1 bacterium]MDZ7337113.1 response regulator [candidate division KSB1 bacterium]MDZ7385940.1 response regulator [candidate division KSB1 bacterium]MDZ7393541.1 response regulator [candidate division KSB1 bacterium]MDZ7412392.1 response regulator [candidate division KSB1 bacterium]